MDKLTLVRQLVGDYSMGLISVGTRISGRDQSQLLVSNGQASGSQSTPQESFGVSQAPTQESWESGFGARRSTASANRTGRRVDWNVSACAERSGECFGREWS